MCFWTHPEVPVGQVETTNSIRTVSFYVKEKHVKYTLGLAQNPDFRGSLFLTFSSCPLATFALQENTKAFNYLLKISGEKNSFS